LIAAGWQPELTLNEMRLLYPDRTDESLSAEEIQRAAADLSAGDPRLTSEQAIGFLAALLECRRRAQSLAFLTAAGACRLERHTAIATLNRTTGKVEFTEPRPLGPYQDVLEQALRHWRIDARRFARCSNEKCQPFL
jgi:hypothetical protein